MAFIMQHVPSFVDVSTNNMVNIEFNSVEELLNINFVKEWSERKNFQEFKICRRDDPHLLMAILNNGKYWVVGYLRNNENLLGSFPEWEN